MVIKEINELEPGMVLVQDVLNSFDTVVLAAGTELTTGLIMNLKAMNIDFVFVEMPEDTALSNVSPMGLTSSVSERENIDSINSVQETSSLLGRSDKRTNVFHAAVKHYKSMYETVALGGTIDSSEVFDIVKDIVQTFYKYDDIFTVLKMTNSDEPYEMTHTSSMCVLSVLLAKWVNLPHQKIYTMAQAAYLSDLGKALVPDDILSKKGALSEDEQMIMQSHVAFTQDVLERSGGFSGELIHIAATHHERLNGSGYPYNMDKEGINQLSRIVAVADTYHALISKRPYREAYSLFEATEMLWNMSYNELDTKVIERLVKFITSFWVGGEVMLSNGMKGKVIMANKFDKFRPLVEVESGFIDLSHDRTCKIVDLVFSG